MNVTDYSQALESYLRRVVDETGRFSCPSGPRCKHSIPAGCSFAAGQLTYVGERYGTEVDGRAERVLVVSMQVGDSEAPVTMQRRTEQVRVRIPQPPKDRNAHMRGVTYALQYLFGLNPATDQENLPDGTHVLDAYAMANSTLCSNLPTAGSSRRGAPTSVMLRECGEHLRRTIEVLEPTVIHSQGRSTNPTVATTHTSIERIADSIDPVDNWNSFIQVGSVRAVWCSLPHPSSGPPFAWQWPNSAFHQEQAAPALRRARALALEATS